MSDAIENAKGYHVLGVIMFGGGIVEKPHRAMVLLCRIQIRWLSSLILHILLAVTVEYPIASQYTIKSETAFPPNVCIN